MSRRGPYRLSAGGQIDRDRSVRFRFDGRQYSGYQGDSLASALLGEGVRTVARSFKFPQASRCVYLWCGRAECHW